MFSFYLKIIIILSVKNDMSEYNPTPLEWLEAQVMNMQFKLNIQREKNNKLKEITECIEKCTENLDKLIGEGKSHEVLDLMVKMNESLDAECQARGKCDEISNEHYDLLYRTVNVLTSKANQVGHAKTPEMKQFQAKMNTHCQMFIKQNVKHFNAYCDNFNDNKPKNNN